MSAHHRLGTASAVAACVLVVACGGRAGSTAASPSAEPSATVAVASATPVATPSATATPDTRPLQGLLPSDFGGSEAHTFAVGEDMLARLATELDMATDDLEVAFASDHGANFVQMYALRAPGHSADEILAGLVLVAFPDAQETTTSTEQRLGVRMVTVISEPTEAARLGTLYCLADGQVLIVAQAFTEAVAEAAFDELPSANPRDY